MVPPKHASYVSITTHKGGKCGVLEFENGMMHECEKKQKKKKTIKEEIKGGKNKERALRSYVRTQYRVQIRNNPIIRRFKAEERETDQIQGRGREILTEGEGVTIEGHKLLIGHDDSDRTYDVHGPSTHIR